MIWRTPSKTELLVMRGYLDMALAGRPDVLGVAYRMLGDMIEHPDRNLWHEKWDAQVPDVRKIEDPETQALIAAVDRWNAKAQWRHEKGDPVERNRHDEMMAELQGNGAGHPSDCGCDYCKPLPVARSATFSSAYNTLEEQMRAKEDHTE